MPERSATNIMTTEATKKSVLPAASPGRGRVILPSVLDARVIPARRAAPFRHPREEAVAPNDKRHIARDFDAMQEVFRPVAMARGLPRVARPQPHDKYHVGFLALFGLDEAQDADCWSALLSALYRRLRRAAALP